MLAVLCGNEDMAGMLIREVVKVIGPSFEIFNRGCCTSYWLRVIKFLTYLQHMFWMFVEPILLGSSSSLKSVESNWLENI